MYKVIEDCLYLNKSIKENNLVKLTWGNASVKSEDSKYVAIKPSGVNFYDLNFSHISILELFTAKHLEGLQPSVDTPLHLEIYKSFPEINSVIHTHSKYATSWAQANLSIPILGTTHADYFLGSIPLARNLEEKELNNYEENIGRSVVEFYQSNKINPLNMPAILLPGHGVLCFSDNTKRTLEAAIVVEEIAEIAFNTIMLNPEIVNSKFYSVLFEKHYERKNGINKYYGQ